MLVGQGSRLRWFPERYQQFQSRHRSNRAQGNADTSTARAAVDAVADHGHRTELFDQLYCSHFVGGYLRLRPSTPTSLAIALVPSLSPDNHFFNAGFVKLRNHGLCRHPRR